MSQIFDALQRSETDRSGTEVPAAKELLEVVERNAAQVTTVAERPRKRRTRRLSTAESFQLLGRRYLPTTKLVCATDEESLAAEKFRFLGVRLRHLQQKRSLKRILVTSSVAGEGKSTIAANLACALARNKQRVLLLDGDLRRPSLASQLGLRLLPGLGELLEGSGTLTANVYRVESLGFWILPAGKSREILWSLCSRKTHGAVGPVGRGIRLDCHRLTSRVATRRYQHLDAAGRCDSAGDAARNNGEATAATKPGSHRAVEASGCSAQWIQRGDGQ